jgi:hypothetical protein
VTITLVDGKVLKDNLGFKADGCKVKGQTDLGSYETLLSDVRTIVLQRKTAPKSIPQMPPPFETYDSPAAKTVFLIETRSGMHTKASGFEFYVQCSGYYINVFYGYRSPFVPVVGGLNIDLTKIKLLEVIGPVQAGKPVPVTITSVDGRSRRYEIRLSDSCSLPMWTIHGRAALGGFDIRLDQVKRVELSSAPPAEPPENLAEAGPGLSGTLVGRQGQSVEFASLSGGLPLKSGFRFDLAKVRSIEFGEESNGQVPVTLTVLDGRVIRDTMDGSYNLAGDLVLGTFQFQAKEIRRVAFKR